MHISADHIINSHSIVVVQLTCLFNCMIRQGYVPDAFGTGKKWGGMLHRVPHDPKKWGGTRLSASMVLPPMVNYMEHIRQKWSI